MFFGKKKEEVKEADLTVEEKPEEDKTSKISANLEVELTKINSQLDALGEVRKTNEERFQRIGEQIGELRGTIVDTSKLVSNAEVAATKAADLVNAVQPDKLMLEVRKTDGKIEALRANVEANEAMMKDILGELKAMRNQMGLFKGTEQIIKMNDEIKSEIKDIKKVEAVIERHADKVETIFLEVEKKFAEFDKFNDVVKDLDRSFRKLAIDFDKIRVSNDDKADKKEFVKLLDKFSDFEKHTGNVLKLLDERSRHIKDELMQKFDALKTQLEKKQNIKLDVEEQKPAELKEQETKEEIKTINENVKVHEEEKKEKEKKSIFGFLKKEKKEEETKKEEKTEDKTEVKTETAEIKEPNKEIKT